MKTQQEVFDKVFKLFFVDKVEPGYNRETGLCVYYDPETQVRCVAGRLLSLGAAKCLADEEVTASAMHNHLSKFPKDQAFAVEHGRLLDRLQNSHDEAARTSEGMEEFRKIFRNNLRCDFEPEKDLHSGLTPIVINTTALENWRESA